MGKKDEEAKRLARARRTELLTRLKTIRADSEARTRSRALLYFRLVIVTVALGFGSTAIFSREDLSDSFDEFHRLCAHIRNGDSLEAVRGLASEKQLKFEIDSDESWRRGVDSYVLRPDESWPLRLGCRFRAMNARLYRD